MLVACWSVKGGSGTTVVAAALALLLARHHRHGVLLVDGAGDLPDVLGVDDDRDRATGGLADWLAAGPGVPADALRRLEVAAADGVALLPWSAPSGGEPEWPPVAPARWDDLAARLVDDPRLVVVDCGSGSPVGRAPARHLLAVADASLLVVRPCFVALRRAGRAERGPTGVVLVEEPGRSFGPIDVEEIVGAPVVAEVDHHRAVATAVDGGLVTMGLPRSLARDLEALVDRLAREAA